MIHLITCWMKHTPHRFGRIHKCFAVSPSRDSIVFLGSTLLQKRFAQTNGGLKKKKNHKETNIKQLNPTLSGLSSNLLLGNLTYHRVGYRQYQAENPQTNTNGGWCAKKFCFADNPFFIGQKF